MRIFLGGKGVSGRGKTGDNPFYVSYRLMKIIFIHPPLSMEAIYGDFSQAGGIEPPLGICYLAAILRRNGYEVEIIDAPALNLNQRQILQKLEKSRPDVVGVSATTPAIVSSFSLLSAIKRSLPGCVTLLGGAHITAVPRETMLKCEAIDAGVIGEAEGVIVRILEECAKVEPDFSKVNGVIFRQGATLVLTAPAERIKDLDDLPFPALDLLPDLAGHYRVPAQSVDRYPSVSLITSRGCGGQCAFCDSTVTGTLPRAHSARYTFELMRWVNKEFGVKSIMFEDDNFLLFRGRLAELGQFLGKEKLDLTWSCASRVDIIDSGTLRLAKDLGCWQIQYGIESGSQKILDFYNKGINIGQIRRAVAMTREAGIKAKGFLMLGNPLETMRTLDETLKLVLNIPLNDISAPYFTPYPGAPVYSEVGKYGNYTDDWEKMSRFNMMFIPFGMDGPALRDFEKKLLRRFYMRPRVVLDYLSRIRSMRHFADLCGSGAGLMKHIFCEGMNRCPAQAQIL